MTGWSSSDAPPTWSVCGSFERVVAGTGVSFFKTMEDGARAHQAAHATEYDSMALGAVAALKAAGKTGEVAVVGYDNISAVQELLKDGRVLATADQHADQLAVYGIEYALEMLRTEETPTNRETPVDLVTAESFAP